MRYRIINKKFYYTEQEAKIDLKKVKDIATNPKVIQGVNNTSWILSLYECATKKRAMQGLDFYKSKGLTVFLQIIN